MQPPANLSVIGSILIYSNSVKREKEKTLEIRTLFYWFVNTEGTVCVKIHFSLRNWVVSNLPIKMCPPKESVESLVSAVAPLSRRCWCWSLFLLFLMIHKLLTGANELTQADCPLFSCWLRTQGLSVCCRDTASLRVCNHEHANSGFILDLTQQTSVECTASSVCPDILFVRNIVISLL